MTADANLVCRRCGYTNVPGDTFCGSCGAFLEWEGERAADPGTASVPAIPPGGYPAYVPPTTPDPTGAAPAPIAPTPAPAGGDLLRCPACGVANAASRTFCQACGSKLAEAGKVAAVSQDQIIAAVNAPNKPVTVTTTTIRRPGGEPEEGGGRGGVLKWIAIMGILGVVVGVAIVLGSSLIRGEGPASSASAAPTSSSTADGSASPGQSAPPSDAPTAEPTKAPANVKLRLVAASASSTVAHGDKFDASKAIDGDPDTCWQEGKDEEAGQWIEVAFAPSKVTAVRLTNGYNASKALYKGNHRLKDIEISINGGPPIPVTLDDTGEPQKFDVKNVPDASSVRITIVSVYKSTETNVHGTPFDDAALGEIEVMGVPGS